MKRKQQKIKTFSLRLPEDFYIAIDESIKSLNLPWELSKNNWILHAIQQKLDQEKSSSYLEKNQVVNEKFERKAKRRPLLGA